MPGRFVRGDEAGGLQDRRREPKLRIVSRCLSIAFKEAQHGHSRWEAALPERSTDFTLLRLPQCAAYSVLFLRVHPAASGPSGRSAPESL